MATKNEKYSVAQKRAYYRGQGYAAAKAGKKINCRTEAEKQSCRNGFNSKKGVK